MHTYSLSPAHSTLVTLRTLAAPLNPADINQIQGTYPSVPPFTTNLGTPQPTAVPGTEACFEVLSAGSGVKSLKPGDWAILRAPGLGTWRTHLQCGESKLVKVDKEGLTSTQVATASVNPVTAWRLLESCVLLSKGSWFIQNGANSGVGRAAMQLGRLWGFQSIAVVRNRPGEEGQRLKKELEELGATKVVTDEEAAGAEFKDQVKEWTNGGRQKVALGLNCVGGEAAMALAKVLSNNAPMVTYGAMSKSPMRVGASMLIFKNIKFKGFWLSKWADLYPEKRNRTVDKVLRLIRSGKLKEVPMVEVPWNRDTKKEELVEAVEGTIGGFRKGKGIFKFGDT